MKGMGFTDYFIAHAEQYYQDYQRNAFAVGAPTDIVRTITGKEPEDFETIVRRYVANTPDARPNFLTMLRYLLRMNLWMLLPGPQTTRHLHKGDFSQEQHLTLSANSPEWQQSHDVPTTSVRANA